MPIHAADAAAELFVSARSTVAASGVHEIALFPLVEVRTAKNTAIHRSAAFGVMLAVGTVVCPLAPRTVRLASSSGVVLSRPVYETHCATPLVLVPPHENVNVVSPDCFCRRSSAYRADVPSLALHTFDGSDQPVAETADAVLSPSANQTYTHALSAAVVMSTTIVGVPDVLIVAPVESNACATAADR